MSLVCDAGVLSHMIADHFPVYIIKKKIRNDKSFKYISGRSYKNYNKKFLKDFIQTNMKWRSKHSMGTDAINHSRGNNWPTLGF